MWSLSISYLGFVYVTCTKYRCASSSRFIVLPSYRWGTAPGMAPSEYAAELRATDWRIVLDQEPPAQWRIRTLLLARVHRHLIRLLRVSSCAPHGFHCPALSRDRHCWAATVGSRFASLVSRSPSCCARQVRRLVRACFEASTPGRYHVTGTVCPRLRTLCPLSYCAHPGR